MGKSYDVIGVQEYSSIAAGVQALDAMVKAAMVEVITTRTVEPGRLVILITGDVASVEASLAGGKAGREQDLVDELFIRNLHTQVIPAIRGEGAAAVWDALGIIESNSVAAGIEAADAGGQGGRRAHRGDPPLGGDGRQEHREDDGFDPRGGGGDGRRGALGDRKGAAASGGDHPQPAPGHPNVRAESAP